MKVMTKKEWRRDNEQNEKAMAVTFVCTVHGDAGKTDKYNGSVEKVRPFFNGGKKDGQYQKGKNEESSL